MSLESWAQTARKRRLRQQLKSQRRRGLLEHLEARYLLTTAPIEPLGSLVYGESFAADFAGVSEIDAYSLDLDAGQTLTGLLVPVDPSILGEIEVFDETTVPATSLGVFTAAAARGPVSFQTLSIATAGTFRIDVSNLAGTGGYDLRTALNAVAEEEILTGVSNDTPAWAEDISSSSIPLSGTADRLAVLGIFASSSDLDTYSFTLMAGQSATLAVDSGGDSAVVELLDNSGTLLASGLTGIANADQVISDLKAPAAGTYLARVRGDLGDDYNLLVTRGTSYDREFNNTSGLAQDIGQTGLGLGSVVSGITESETQNNVFSPNVLTYAFAASPVAGDVTMDLTVRADLSSTTEYLDLNAEGVFTQRLWEFDGNEDVEQSQTLTIAAAEFNQMLLDDGVATFTFTPSAQVDNFGC